MAVALQAAFQAYQGLWFGWSGKVASQPASQPRMVDKGRVQYALMDLTSLDRREYYNGFANRALWPTMHYRVGLSDFSRADYTGYLRVNRTFASALAKLLYPSDLVWVHDYHLIPLAAQLRALGLTNAIGYFHHIPWPAPEVLGTLPGRAASAAVGHFARFRYTERPETFPAHRAQLVTDCVVLDPSASTAR